MLCQRRVLPQIEQSLDRRPSLPVALTGIQASALESSWSLSQQALQRCSEALKRLLRTNQFVGVMNEMPTLW